MNETTRDEMFAIIIGMSDRAVDPSAKAILRGLLGRPNAAIKDELLALIDRCVFGALTSDMIISCLDSVWRHACGGTQQELDTRPTPVISKEGLP